MGAVIVRRIVGIKNVSKRRNASGVKITDDEKLYIENLNLSLRVRV